MNKNYESGDLKEMKKEVKKVTGYNLKQIVIEAYTTDFIDYSIYKNLSNDILLGKAPIDTGRVEL